MIYQVEIICSNPTSFNLEFSFSLHQQECIQILKKVMTSDSYGILRYSLTNISSCFSKNGVKLCPYL